MSSRGLQDALLGNPCKRLALHFDEMVDFSDHASNLRRVVLFNGLVQFTKAQGNNGLLLALRLPDGATNQRDFQLRHSSVR